ncbi:MAG: hypothetical protein JOZ10_07950 [Acidobacteria bacterium]|nr:hypothetical protein [Acidobacteriota bacterium]MBV9144458.1 hypothetical protein [Acidobacteriota bacterium]MBV9436888.1 hypothetical protein [Acidobacteriota bacterium]
MASTDRDLQDEVIRYLSDGSLRNFDIILLDPEEANRARRFSRFLARRYYRDRLSRGFRYVRMLIPKFSVEQLIDSPGFDSILGECVLGSFNTSSLVAEFAVSALRTAQPQPWWSELLEYERAFFLQLATSEFAPAAAFPRKQLSTVLHAFDIPISELLSRIRGKAELESISRGQSILLFSRTQHGTIYAAELDSLTANVFASVDGISTSREIAARCALSEAEVDRILQMLADIGSIALPQR